MKDLVTQNPPTREDLIEIANRMHDVAERTYWVFFNAGMGAHCHAFLEFNGVLSKYAQICGQAAAQGIDFTQANVHSNTPLPVAAHDVEYLAEKLGCILGPLINANPEARKAFARAFFHGGLTPEARAPRDLSPAAPRLASLESPAALPGDSLRSVHVQEEGQS